MNTDSKQPQREDSHHADLTAVDTVLISISILTFFMMLAMVLWLAGRVG